MARNRTRRYKTRKVKRHHHTKSCRHNSVSLEKMNGKCYKNGRKIPCSKFVREERNVVKSMGKSMSKSMNKFLDMFKF